MSDDPSAGSASSGVASSGAAGVPTVVTPLPAPPRPRGSYQPWVEHDGLVVTAGMTPRDADGVLLATGLVGGEVDPTLAREVAAAAARNALAAVVAAAGGRDRVRRCLRMSVYVACVEGFTELSAVADGASAALEEHLGPVAGRPARSAIGVRALPGGAPVEIELMVAVEPGTG